MTIDNSIIDSSDGDSPLFMYYPDKAVITINCILTNNVTPFLNAGATDVAFEDLAFVDRGVGNLQLTTASPAIDRCPEVIGGHDLACRERNHKAVVPLMTAAKGSAAEFSDMDAFEFIGVIFANGFEFEGPPFR